MSFAPAVEVDGITRQPLPYGLFSVLTPRSDADPHWQNGIFWEALTCAPASGFNQDCDPADPGNIGTPFNTDVGVEWGTADPFSVYGAFSCTPTAGITPERAQELATQHLLTREESRVEQAIWTGDLGNTGFAKDAVNARTTVAAVKLKLAVASLEQWIATNYGSVGVIHMTRQTAALALSENSVILARGNALYTLLGTPVVAGAGYPGTGPDGAAAAAGQQYIYATPAMLGYRSEPFSAVSPAEAGLDRSNNDMMAVTERTYEVGWDPCGTAYALADLEV